MREKCFQNALIDLAPRCHRSIRIQGKAQAIAHQIVEERIARSGIARNRLLARRDKTQIGDAANIDHRDRLQKARGSRERAMKHGNERRPLPAVRDIGGTKIMRRL